MKSLTCICRDRDVARGRGHFGDADVMEVTQLALCGLVQQTANVA